MVFVECDVPLVLVFGCVGSAGLAVSTPTYDPIQPIIDCGDTQLKVYGPGSEAPTTCQPAQMLLVQSNCVNPAGAVNVPPAVKPVTMTRTSFCCVPAGSMTVRTVVVLSPVAT